MSAPRILFVSDHLGHADGRIHGATRYFLNVLPRLQAAGFAIEAVFLREEHAQAKTLRDAGIDPVFLNCGKYDFTAFRPLKRLIRQRGVDLIHASGLKGMLMARCASGSLPLFLHLHDMIPVRPAVCAPLLGATFRRADRILCVSEAVSTFARDHLRIPASKVLALRNGIPITDSPNVSKAEVCAEIGLPDKNPLFIWVGRLDDTKNPFGALEAFSRMASHSSHPSLVLVGEGEGRDQLTQQVKKLKVENQVVLTGQRDDLPRLLAAADLMLCTPKSEGLGLAAMEALAAGCPVLASKVGGLVELIDDGQNGRLLPPDNPEALAEASIDLLESPEALETMSVTAKRSAKAFDIEEHIASLTRLYLEAIP